MLSLKLYVHGLPCESETLILDLLQLEATACSANRGQRSSDDYSAAAPSNYEFFDASGGSNYTDRVLLDDSADNRAPTRITKMDPLLTDSTLPIASDSKFATGERPDSLTTEQAPRTLPKFLRILV